jgi:(+)-pinoresinol hydroxylase
VSSSLTGRRAILAAMLLVNLPHAVAADTTIGWNLVPSSNQKGISQIERGGALFQSACAICHGVGIDRPGTSSLEIKYRGRLPALLEKRTDLTSERVIYYIRHGVAMMPQFRKTELSDTEAAAIAAYLARRR